MRKGQARNSEIFWLRVSSIAKQSQAIARSIVNTAPLFQINALQPVCFSKNLTEFQNNLTVFNNQY
jgi:hypothetical protein